MKAQCPPAHGRGKKEDHANEALTVTSSASTSGYGKRKCRKGTCNHCSKEGHWIWECHTKKQEEATAHNQGAQSQSGGSAQASLGNSGGRPENKPIGSVNVVMTKDFDGDGF